MAFGKYILNASTAKEYCVFLTGVEKIIPDMKFNLPIPAKEIKAKNGGIHLELQYNRKNCSGHTPPHRLIPGRIGPIWRYRGKESDDV